MTHPKAPYLTRGAEDPHDLSGGGVGWGKQLILKYSTEILDTLKFTIFLQCGGNKEMDSFDKQD